MAMFGGLLTTLAGRLATWVLRKTFGSGKRVLFRLAYRVVIREIGRGAHLRKRFSPIQKGDLYLALVVIESVGTLGTFCCALATISGSTAIAVAYGLERPWLLVLFMSLSAALALKVIQSAALLWGLLSAELDGAYDEAETKMPASFKAWSASVHFATDEEWDAYWDDIEGSGK